MSLLDDFLEPCAIMKKTSASDGEGGYNETWTEDSRILASVVMDSSTLAQIAEKDGVTSVYTITTGRSVKLSFHSVIKRLSDGSVFRVTSQTGEKKTPKTTTLDMNQVNAERWKLT